MYAGVHVVWFPIQGMGNRMLDVRLRRALAGWAATLAADAAGPDYEEGRRGLREASVGGAMPALAAVARLPGGTGS